MAFRRQRLSRRRKAVGFTQESLAERLGVERSTIVRWEAGDTEPLPSIRPNLASALQVSLDQLAELLASTEDAGRKRAPSAGTEVTVPELLPELRSQVQPDRAEPGSLARSQAVETAEALRRTLRSADVSPEYVDALLLVCGVSRAPLVTQLLSDGLGGPAAIHAHPQAAVALSGLPSKAAYPANIDVASADVRLDRLVPTTAVAARSGVAEVAHVEVANQQPLTTTPSRWHRATSRRLKRFAAAGLLILAGAAASVPLVSSPRAATAPAVAEVAPSAQPEAAPLAPNPTSNNDNAPRSQDTTGAAPPAPAAPSNTSEGPAPHQAVAAPAPRKVRATSGNRSASRSRQPAAKTPPPHPSAAEARAWAEEAALSAREQAARLRSQSSSRP